jgi:ketosteroid isomerase-like protein
MIINDETVVREVEAAVGAYEEALNANDLDALDAFFWTAPETVRFGVSENLYGFEAIAAFRKGRVGGSPPRRRLRTTVAGLGLDVAVAHVEFQRNDTGRLGRQSQTWIRTPEGWKVACAHVSLLSGTPDQRGGADRP